MSFDLFVFEKREEIKTSLDVFAYLEEFTEYKENKDYESLEGCSRVIACWAKKMFEKFPPISGEYALPDEIAYATEDSENYLTDYSLGKNGVYCAFSYNVEDEALEFVKSIADEYGVGIYNPQSSDTIFCKGIDILKCRTESTDDFECDWENIENFIEKFNDIDRVNENGGLTFITIWYETDGKQGNFIQCTPCYKNKGFFSSLFSKKISNEIDSYIFEIEKNGGVYQTFIEDKAELTKVIKAWCIDRKEPDIREYKRILDL